MNHQDANATEARLRRVVMIVRQGLYFVADELGKEYGLERPCKQCEQRRRASRAQDTSKERAA